MKGQNMVDGTLTSAASGAGITLARIKVGTPVYQPQNTGLTDAESRLADIVDIGSAVQDRAQKTRRLNGYLRYFQSFLKFLNNSSGNTSVRPQTSPVDIEYIKMDNPYKRSIDRKV